MELFTCVWYFLLVTIIVKQTDAIKVSYQGHQMWQVRVDQNISSDVIDKINEQDVWGRDGKIIDFLLNANETEYWDKFLEAHNMSYRILLKDIQKEIDKETLMKKEDTRRGGRMMTWTSYPNLKEIYVYLDSIAASNREHCTVTVIGKTAHMKDIKMLKLSNGNRNNQAIVVEAGMHAREWTAVVSVLYFIEGIARNFSKHPTYITDNDWYIIPVLNPDGYEYSMSKDRLWRKNRRTFSGPCDGVDINRNFDFSWCGRGGSNIICNPNYCGVHPFSEKESIAIRDLITGTHFMAYISVHSYGRKILFPWALNGNPTADIKTHIRVSKQVAAAMYEVDEHTFKTGTIGKAGVNSGGGMAADWVYTQGVVHTYILETRGESIGGYFLEPAQILIAVKEVFAGLMKLAKIM